MDYLGSTGIPEVVQRILKETENIGFQMVSEPLVGTLLRTLAASKSAGRFLELGTGTGVSTAWILEGMDAHSMLVTVENDAALIDIAKAHLGGDQRVTFHVTDGGSFMENLNPEEEQFDLIFADTWAGKYTHLFEALNTLKPGGLYVIDDMLPQSNWPEGHELKVKQLITELEARTDLKITKIDWASGVILAVKC
jgi:predicted O-methyltransferase YrrM